MKEFMGDDFLLQTQTAQLLYDQYAKHMPIFDYHCHLSPKEIWENKQFDSITEVWLGGDHYKWRQMRSMGIPESLITGKETTPKEKFLKWAEIMPYLVGNPLYHWTHLELRRFFGIQELLNEHTAESIWEQTNAKLMTEDYRARALIERSNVYAICTTDDPADTLEYHARIKSEGKMKTIIVPAMRPDKALQPEKPGFAAYIETLAQAASMEITSYLDLQTALLRRIDYFDQMGCKACDHAFNYIPYAPAVESQLEHIYQKGIEGVPLTIEEQDQYKTDLMLFLSKQYKKYDWAMEIHIGALRDNNERMYQQLGPDTGFDAVNDYNYAPSLAKLLSAMDKDDQLPKTILFTLNPKDNFVLTTLMGCFQGTQTASKIQNGSAWWFLDHKTGMEEQMKTLAATGLLSKFVGMVTDSRSFLSYPRHEYFRRILCNLLGSLVESGEYPNDLPTLGAIVEDICFHNAKAYIPVQ